MLVHQIRKLEGEVQNSTSLSHSGGVPNIPARIKLPSCQFCGSLMTFFFQIEFPKRNKWAGKIMAIFACTSCAPRDYFFPPMPPGGRHLGLPDNFLDDYEKTFHIVIFESNEATEIRLEYIPLLKYEQLELSLLKTPSARITRIGGKPNWRMSDDTPKVYMGSRFTFLMQIWNDNWEWEFDKLPDAPQQAQFSFLGNPYRTDNKYVLFSGVHQLYFFGTLDLEIPKVYVLNQ